MMLMYRQTPDHPYMLQLWSYTAQRILVFMLSRWVRTKLQFEREGLELSRWSRVATGYFQCYI